MTKKILGICAAVLTVATSLTSAIDFSFTSFSAEDPIGDKFADAHFFTPGNDYAGSFFWLPTQQILPAAQVVLGTSVRNCTKQVRGLYFSNAWGARLWPIDAQTLTGLMAIDPAYSGLTMTGGFYTSCTNTGTSLNTGLELYSIYGQMNYTWKGNSFSLSMGRRYDISTNAILPGAPLVSSLQYFNNQTPIGYFYDNVAGIGFIGGSMPLVAHTGIVDTLNSGGHVDAIFRFATGSTSTLVASTPSGSYSLNGAVSAGLDTLWRIAVLGNVLLSKGGLSTDDRRSVLGNPNQTSIIVSDKMNISNSINQLKRNASNLCRGKKVYTEANWLTATDSDPRKIVCIGSAGQNYSELSDVTINLANTSDYNGKTIIVYGRNVVLQDTMPQSNSYALNLFVDKGNVIFKESSSLINFDSNGNLGGTIGGNFLRGNIFINGLFYGLNGTPLTHKLYIHGKFASLNTGLEPTTARKTQIESLLNNAFTTFGTTLVNSYCGSNNCINFNNVFAWQCKLDGQGSDGNLCNVAGDRFKYNPFIIIDTNIDTPLVSGL